MFKLGRREPKPQQATGAAPPPPVVPWRVPPTGSLGDAWDAVVALPEARPTSSPDAPIVNKRRRRRRHPGDVVFLDWQPPLHATVIVAWVLVGLSLASTGPLAGWMPLWAGAAILLGGTSLWILKTSSSDSAGTRPAALAIGVGVLLLAYDTAQPRISVAQAWFGSHAAMGRVVILDTKGKMLLTEDLMPHVANAAWYLLSIRRGNTMAVGRDSLNAGLPGGSPHFPISSFARMDEGADDFRADVADFLELIPADPFARDGGKFGLFITRHEILVYSIGPDGVWQINPRMPVDPDCPDAMKELGPMLYSPGGGPNAPGDLLTVLPLTLDLYSSPDPADVTDALKQYKAKGTLPALPADREW